MLAGQQLASSAYKDYEDNLKLHVLLMATAVLAPLEDWDEGKVDVREVEGIITRQAKTLVNVKEPGKIAFYSKPTLGSQRFIPLWLSKQPTLGALQTIVTNSGP